MKTNKITVFDTTLRDGTQGLGVELSADDKLRIAIELDAFGVDIIEGGWPGSNPTDLEFFRLAAKHKWRHAQIAAFSMTRRKGIAVEDDPNIKKLLEAETPVVVIVGKSWLLHVNEVLRVKPSENIAMIADTIRYLKSQEKIVIYDAEHAFDGWKDNGNYAMSTWQAAEEAGADCVVLCDTNGGSLPNEVAQVVRLAVARLMVPVGIHTHNDTGLAVANTLAAVDEGATHVQGTINGYGERTGNCNLITLLPLLHFKSGLKTVPGRSFRKLRRLSRFVDEVMNLDHDPRAPWVGTTAFAHKGGMHVHAVNRVKISYEHIDPAKVGNRRRVVMSNLGGRTNLVLKAEELGVSLTLETPGLDVLVGKIKHLVSAGYEFEVAEGSLALLMYEHLNHRTWPFEIVGHHVSIRQDSKGADVCQAVVKVKVDEKMIQTVADGDGPVHALDSALRKALVDTFPKLRRVQLVDYKVRNLRNHGSQSGVAAKTRVLIQSTDGKREWGTVGVHPNIVSASLQALCDSFEFALLKSR